MNLITAKGLTKHFQGREVVKGIDLTVEQGRVLALIGPNGAGKSTTISMLTGILKPDGGQIEHWRSDYRGHIGVQLQTTPFFEGYTVEENLKLFAALYRIRLSSIQLNERLEAYGLLDSAKTPAIRLSLGQQKRLAIAVTTVHQPDLIVLDEPTSGLDPRARHEIREMIRAFAGSGRTVLFSSHDMEEVKRTADSLLLMNGGRIVASGNPETLLQEHQAEDLEALYIKLTGSDKKEDDLHENDLRIDA